MTNYRPPEMPRADDPECALKLMRCRAYEHGYARRELLDRDSLGDGCVAEYRRGLGDGGFTSLLAAFDQHMAANHAPPVVPAPSMPGPLLDLAPRGHAPRRRNWAWWR
jgi:hypothetical protein